MVAENNSGYVKTVCINGNVRYSNGVICGKCGTKYTIDENDNRTVSCPHCNPNYKPPIKIDNSNKPLSCPKCNSQSISTNRRGWKLTTGFLGSSKMINTCQHCGYQWNPKWEHK